MKMRSLQLSSPKKRVKTMNKDDLEISFSPSCDATYVHTKQLPQVIYLNSG